MVIIMAKRSFMLGCMISKREMCGEGMEKKGKLVWVIVGVERWVYSWGLWKKLCLNKLNA